MSETSPLLEVYTTLERGPGGLRAERRFWPGCCEHSSSQLPFGPPTRQTLQMATARMYPDGVQHFWSLLARTIGIGALEARFLEFWNGGVRSNRRRFDSVIRVTRTAGDGRKEGAKHIQTYSSTVWINLDISRHPRRADCGFKREDRFAG